MQRALSVLAIVGAVTLSGCLADLVAGYRDCGEGSVDAREVELVPPGRPNVTVHVWNDAEGASVVCVRVDGGPPIELQLCGSDGHNGCAGSFTAAVDEPTFEVDVRERVRGYRMNGTFALDDGNHVVAWLTEPSTAQGAMRLRQSEAVPLRD